MSFGKKILDFKEDILKDLDELLKIQSVSSKSQEDASEALKFILKRAEEMGLTTENVDDIAGHAEYGKGDEKIAKSHGHSTNMQAAQVAKDASAKRLLLNHVSARFLGRDIGKMAADAKTIFENTHIVRDLEEVEI